MKKIVLITDGISSDAKKKLEKYFIVKEKKGLTPEKLKEEIKGVNAVI